MRKRVVLILKVLGCNWSPECLCGYSSIFPGACMCVLTVAAHPEEISLDTHQLVVLFLCVDRKM